MERFFTTIDFISSWIWVITVIAMPWLFINFLRFRSAYWNPSKASVRFPLISFCLFSGPILFIMFCGNILAFHERNRVLEVLNDPGTHPAVVVNGVTLANGDQVLAALKDLASLPAHHSHPVQTLVLDIHSSRGELRLNLGRDSGDKHEYWVFSPAYWFTTRNEIGRLRTPIFDNIP